MHRVKGRRLQAPDAAKPDASKPAEKKADDGAKDKAKDAKKAEEAKAKDVAKPKEGKDKKKAEVKAPAAPAVQNPLASVLEKPFMVMYMLAGIPLMFLGYKYMKPSICVVGLVGGQFATFLMLTAFWDWVTYGDAVVISVFVGTFLVGVGLGLGLWFMPKFGKAVLGLVSGAVLGMQIYGLTVGVVGVRILILFI